MHIILRQATETDVPLICTLAGQIWRAHYPDIITHEQIDYMLELWYNPDLIREQIVTQQQQVWMITVDDAPQACGYLAIGKKEAGAYYLHKFYIDQRGKGIGAQVFQMVLDKYPDLRTLRLNVNRRNIKSVNFYFKMGFKIESVMDLQVGDELIMDDFVMIRNEH
jgi:diamine N-acetyltransferase